jgi:hypothetical protein
MSVPWRVRKAVGASARIDGRDLGDRGVVVSPTGERAGKVSLDGRGPARGSDGVARTSVCVPWSRIDSTGKIGLDAGGPTVGEEAAGATAEG